MVKTSFEIEKEFLDDLDVRHGSIEHWMMIAIEAGITSNNDLVSFLKTRHAFNHLDASLLAGVILNGGEPVYANEDGLLADQFINKEYLKPLYRQLLSFLEKNIPTSKVIVKRTYISLSARRDFLAIAIKSKEIRLSIDLEGEPTVPFTKTRGIGCKPWISHMIKLVDNSQLNNELLNNIKLAYEKNS